MHDIQTTDCVPLLGPIIMVPMVRCLMGQMLWPPCSSLQALLPRCQSTLGHSPSPIIRQQLCVPCHETTTSSRERCPRARFMASRRMVNVRGDFRYDALSHPDPCGGGSIYALRSACLVTRSLITATIIALGGRCAQYPALPRNFQAMTLCEHDADGIYDLHQCIKCQGQDNRTDHEYTST